MRVLDDRSIAFPSYDGSGMYLSGGNVAGNPEERAPDVLADVPAREGLYGGDEDGMCPGWSAIVSPEGKLAAAP